MWLCFYGCYSVLNLWLISILKIVSMNKYTKISKDCHCFTFSNLVYTLFDIKHRRLFYHKWWIILTMTIFWSLIRLGRLNQKLLALVVMIEMCSRYCMWNGVRCKWRNNTPYSLIYQTPCQWDNCIPTHEQHFRGACQIWLTLLVAACAKCPSKIRCHDAFLNPEDNKRPLFSLEQLQSLMAMNFKIVHFWMPNSSRSKKFWHFITNLPINWNKLNKLKTIKCQSFPGTTFTSPKFTTLCFVITVFY